MGRSAQSVESVRGDRVEHIEPSRTPSREPGCDHAEQAADEQVGDELVPRDADLVDERVGDGDDRRPAEQQSEHHAEQRPEQADDRRLPPHTGLQLAPCHADGAQQADLPGALQHGEGHRVDDAEEGDHEAQHEQSGDHHLQLGDLAQIGFFDQQQLNVVPKPNPETGTVDLEYTVVERSTSQLELQGGWGGGTIIGTLGLNFNNFSARNIFNGDSWKPLPSGDGQTISLRAQSNGRQFQSYSFSFTEPWLGGKKPTSFTATLYHNIQTNGLPKNDPRRQALYITGVNFGLGKRLKWPDDYFTLYQAVEFKRFRMNNYPTSFLDFNNGESKSVNYTVTLARNSTDVPIFPTKGSQISGTVELTPPFSYFTDIDYTKADSEVKYEWIEYYKWKLSADWFTPMAFKNKLVLRTHAEFGFLGYYNADIGLPPFERFYLGGDGLQNFVIDGREVIGLRGYPNQSLTPLGGGSIYNKFILETRFLISPNPSAQIFMLGFLEAGTNVNNFYQYRPFELKRSAGVGLRIFMPMFGLLGIDLGYGFDNIPGTIRPSGWQTHFIIGQQF